MYSFKMSFWMVPRIFSLGHPLLLGHQLVEEQQDGAGGVDRHGRRDLVHREVGHEEAHVGQRVDGHADLAHLALGPGVVGVVAHLGRQVEGARQPGLAGLEQELEALVGLLGRAEAGVLAHRPQLRAVHLGVDAPGVGERPRLAQLRGRVPALEVLRRGRRAGWRCPSRCGARGCPGGPSSPVSRQRAYGGSGWPGHTGQTTGVDDAPEPAFSHFGICVSDLERSLRFYCDALGFEKAESHAIGSEFARLMDLPDVAVTSQFIRRGPDRHRAPGLPRARALRRRASGGPSTSSA